MSLNPSIQENINFFYFFQNFQGFYFKSSLKISNFFILFNYQIHNPANENQWMYLTESFGQDLILMRNYFLDILIPC